MFERHGLSPAPRSPRIRLGDFCLDAADLLLRDGAAVPVTRKALAVLAYLVSEPGAVCSKAALFQSVWSGTVVTDSALSRVIHELRVALHDDVASPRYIATVHGIGFRFVGPVCVDTGAEADRPRVAPWPVLGGRQRELLGLDAAFADAGAGCRSVVFVTGESGSGKTALIDAFMARRRVEADCWTAQGRCIEQYGKVEPLLPFREALENLARAVGVPRFCSVFARYAPAWLALLAWLGSPNETTLPGTAADAAGPQRLLREFAHALEVLADDRPIVLWLEDLQWSDPSSLDVLTFFAGRAVAARVLIVASFRRDDAGLPLKAVSRRLRQRGQAQELALDALDPLAATSHLQQRRGDGVAAVSVAALARSMHAGQRADRPRRAVARRGQRRVDAEAGTGRPGRGASRRSAESRRCAGRLPA